MRKYTLRTGGLGHAEAAERLGVASDSILRWETGRQSPLARTVERMCALYGAHLKISIGM